MENIIGWVIGIPLLLFTAYLILAVPYSTLLKPIYKFLRKENKIKTISHKDFKKNIIETVRQKIDIDKIISKDKLTDKEYLNEIITYLIIGIVIPSLIDLGKFAIRRGQKTIFSKPLEEMLHNPESTLFKSLTNEEVVALVAFIGIVRIHILLQLEKKDIDFENLHKKNVETINAIFGQQNNLDIEMIKCVTIGNKWIKKLTLSKEKVVQDVIRTLNKSLYNYICFHGKEKESVKKIGGYKKIFSVIIDSFFKMLAGKNK